MICGSVGPLEVVGCTVGWGWVARLDRGRLRGRWFAQALPMGMAGS